jgi:hypothetical protein
LSALDCAEEQIARAIANFLKLPYLSHIDADEVQLDRLPAHFAKANLVVATERDGSSMIVLANPSIANWSCRLARFPGRVTRLCWQ